MPVGTRAVPLHCKHVDAGGDMVKGLFQLLHLVSEVGSKPINSWRSCKVSSKRNIGIQERARGNELGKQRLIRVPMVLTGVSLKRDQSARQCVFSSRFPLQRARSSLHPRLWHLPSFPGASLVAHTVKNLPAIQETGVRSPGQEDPLGILTWRIPCTEEPGGPQSMGSQTVGHG